MRRYMADSQRLWNHEAHALAADCTLEFSDDVSPRSVTRFLVADLDNPGSLVSIVARARENARRNGLDRVDFYTADLYGELVAEPWMQRHFDKNQQSLAELDLSNRMTAAHPGQGTFTSVQSQTAGDTVIVTGQWLRPA